MKKQILQPPSNTVELLGRSAYLEEARNKPLNDLTASITLLKQLFVRLTDIVTYNEADVVRSATGEEVSGAALQKHLIRWLSA